jgi:hypothetical protein
LHVHCWTPTEFNELLAYSIGRFGQTWDLIEALVSDDWVPAGIEFGYVLRKSTVELGPEDRRARFCSSWEDLSVHRNEVLVSQRVDAFSSCARAGTRAAAEGPARLLHAAYRCIRERIRERLG